MSWCSKGPTTPGSTTAPGRAASPSSWSTPKSRLHGGWAGRRKASIAWTHDITSKERREGGKANDYLAPHASDIGSPHEHERVRSDLSDPLSHNHCRHDARLTARPARTCGWAATLSEMGPAGCDREPGRRRLCYRGLGRDECGVGWLHPACQRGRALHDSAASLERTLGLCTERFRTGQWNGERSPGVCRSSVAGSELNP